MNVCTYDNVVNKYIFTTCRRYLHLYFFNFSTYLISLTKKNISNYYYKKHINAYVTTDDNVFLFVRISVCTVFRFVYKYEFTFVCTPLLYYFVCTYVPQVRVYY